MIAPLVRAAHDAKARCILFASTAAVYGRRSRPALETDEPLPLAPYGLAKLAAEKLLLAQDLVPATVLRIGNVIGADALMGAQEDAGEIVLDPVEGREGGPIRSWIGPKQLASLLARLALLPLPKVLNLASDPPLAMGELLQAAGRPWRYGPPRKGVLDFAVLDTQLLQSLCKCEKATPAGMAREAAWAKDVPR